MSPELRDPDRVTFVLWQFPEDGGCGRATELLARALLRTGTRVDFVSMVPGVRSTDLDTVTALRLSHVHRRPVFREAAGLKGKVRGLGLLVMKRLDAAQGLRTLRRRLDALGGDSVVVFTNVGPKRMLDEAGYRPRPGGPVLIGQHHSSCFGARATGQLDEMPDHFHDVDAFVTLTHEDADQFQEILSVPCVAIPNIAPAVQRLNADTSIKVAVALTRYASEKRLDVMIRAFHEATRSPELRDWELHLYGSGELRGELQALVEELGLTRRVRINDRTTEGSRVLSGAAVNLMTSEYEGFPMAVLEAAAHGVPTVAFDCSAGMRELVSTGTGVLVPQDDFAGYVTALREVMSNDPERRELGASARASVARYDERTVVEQWLALFRQCATQRTPGVRP